MANHFDHQTPTDASVDALVAATAGLGVPDVGPGYPVLKLLQKNNDEVDKYNREKYIPGAEPGMYWLAAAKALMASPVAHLLGLRAYWAEWSAGRGGGAPIQHPERPGEAIKERHPSTGRETWVMPNGNILEQTVDLAMSIDGIVCGLPHKSTGLTALRNGLVYPLKQKRIAFPNGVRKPPAFFHTKTTLGSKSESNSFGSWLSPTYNDIRVYREEGGPSKEEIVAAYPQAQGFLQLSSEQLATLPNFAAVVTDPPVPPAAAAAKPAPSAEPIPQWEHRGGPIDIRSKPAVWDDDMPPAPDPHDPGPSAPGDRGPPIDLDDIS
jgi:hypothetical protein